MITQSAGPEEQLQSFRKTHTVRRQVIGGHEWSFVSSGTGAQTLVLLPGGGGGAESMFPIIPGLEKRFRIISIGCPDSASKVIDIIEGIKTILDENQVDKCCFLGHSLGGIISECFLGQYPERVGSLILANVANYSPLRVAIFKPLLAVLSRLPQSMLESQIKGQFERSLKNHPHRDFWLSYFAEAEIANLRSNGLANKYSCMRDLISNYSISPAKVSKWLGKVLILETDDETGFTRRERAALRALYPNAKMHVFSKAGHLSFLTRPQEFVGAVMDFLLPSRA